MSRVAIVAALEREVGPLIREWRVIEKEVGGRRFVEELERRQRGERRRR
jgi:hypothetical protein